MTQAEPCKRPGCPQPVHARGYCTKHYSVERRLRDNQESLADVESELAELLEHEAALRGDIARCREQLGIEGEGDDK